jgi:hypothetical protein
MQISFRYPMWYPINIHKWYPYDIHMISSNIHTKYPR